MSVPLSPEALESYRKALRLKVWYHLGSLCRDAEDVIQETLARFLRAVENDAVRTPDNIGAFLSGICNNVILEYRRAARREQLMGADLAASAHAAAPEIEWLEARDAIDAILPLLPDRDREVLRGFYLEEKAKEELCDQMGLSPANLRVVLFRAKERFRRIFQDRMKPPGALRH